MWWLIQACATLEPDPGPPLLVLVSIDTLRADRLGAYGNPDGITPNLDRFASEAVIFEHAYAQANETSFSHASLLTSRFPSELGRLDTAFTLPEHATTLAGVLRAYGYQTGGMVAGGFLSPSFGFANGFDAYDAVAQWGSFHHTAPRAVRWLEERDPSRPAFLFLHGYDAHQRYLKPTPFGYAFADVDHGGFAEEAVRAEAGTMMIANGVYTPNAQPIEFLTSVHARVRPADVDRVLSDGDAPLVEATPADLAHIRGVYDGAVAYADAKLGVFFAELDRLGLYDRAWIVIVSDHGEELGERGTFNHRFNLEEEETHVPLMIRRPGGQGGGRRVKGLVELLDVMPTLLEVASAVPPAGIRGHSLLAALDGAPTPPRVAAFTEGSLRIVSARSLTGRLVFSGMSPDNPWIADTLAAARIDGPGFTGDEPALRDTLVAWRRDVVPAAGGGPELSEEVRAELRAKGYWEGGP